MRRPFYNPPAPTSRPTGRARGACYNERQFSPRSGHVPIRRGRPAAFSRGAVHREPEDLDGRVPGHAHGPSRPRRGAGRGRQDDAFFSHRFLSPRPLLQAIESDDRVVLLIDEIDKAEPEFEAFLLEVLSDFQVSVPELGTIQAKHIPLVVLTSNNARELSDGLKRRCLHLFIDFPAPAEELAIIRLKVPEVSERLAAAVVSAVQRIRAMELRKLPSVSESLDWARSLVILNADRLDAELVESTLTILVKYEKDLERVRGSL